MCCHIPSDGQLRQRAHGAGSSFDPLSAVQPESKIEPSSVRARSPRRARPSDRSHAAISELAAPPRPYGSDALGGAGAFALRHRESSSAGCADHESSSRQEGALRVGSTLV